MWWPHCVQTRSLSGHGGNIQYWHFPPSPHPANNALNTHHTRHNNSSDTDGGARMRSTKRENWRENERDYSSLRCVSNSQFNMNMIILLTSPSPSPKSKESNTKKKGEFGLWAVSKFVRAYRNGPKFILDILRFAVCEWNNLDLVRFHLVSELKMIAARYLSHVKSSNYHITTDCL